MFISKVALFAAVVVFALSSCQKENENAQVKNGQATITGKAQANFDLSNDVSGTTYDNMPDGTKIYARISSKDLVASPSSATYADIIYTTTVTGGTFTFTIDANKKDVTVTLFSDDTRHDQKQGDGSTVQKIFNLPVGGSAYKTTVVDGVSKIVDVTFNAN